MEEKKKTLHHSGGVTYFDKQTERSFFFILTMVMLALGVLAKFGLF